MSTCKKCLDFYIADQDPEDYRGLCNECIEVFCAGCHKKFPIWNQDLWSGLCPACRLANHYMYFEDKELTKSINEDCKKYVEKMQELQLL